MAGATILDTETTGIDDPRPCQIAWSEAFSDLRPVIVGNRPIELHSQFFNPGKPISYGAMATHHIMPTELIGAPPWTTYTLPPDTGYLIGHNIDYDWQALGQPDVKRICTLALAKRLWPQADSHSLTALMYMLNGEGIRMHVMNAHDASVDIGLCRNLLAHILEHPQGAQVETLEQLWELSEVARVPEFMDFGKYGPDNEYAKTHGGPMRCNQVKFKDPGYYRWLQSSCDQVRDNPYLRKALG